ncbi:hypothetical protein [Rhizobium aethiopicum]|uniref:Uncharacterized protein n=1 Tax=Rhizobium aethiopicum TaxID=1138170 RepID=A0A7W6Q976_9HYPH|nr:hypothetical protein [Rhizobium aethiopicum]MBB4192754.1 hypothetical protein [Rhizobium aethiopicum]
MTILPPLTGTPLDYVPIDAPVGKRSANDQPTRFKAPALRRAAIAAIVAGVSVALFILTPAVFIGAVSIAFISVCVWGTDKLIKAIDSHDQT